METLKKGHYECGGVCKGYERRLESAIESLVRGALEKEL